MTEQAATIMQAALFLLAILFAGMIIIVCCMQRALDQKSKVLRITGKEHEAAKKELLRQGELVSQKDGEIKELHDQVAAQKTAKADLEQERDIAAGKATSAEAEALAKQGVINKLQTLRRELEEAHTKLQEDFGKQQRLVDLLEDTARSARQESNELKQSRDLLQQQLEEYLDKVEDKVEKLQQAVSQ